MGHKFFTIWNNFHKPGLSNCNFFHVWEGKKERRKEGKKEKPWVDLKCGPAQPSLFVLLWDDKVKVFALLRYHSWCYKTLTLWCILFVIYKYYMDWCTLYMCAWWWWNKFYTNHISISLSLYSAEVLSFWQFTKKNFACKIV